jgi:hypothetical protein
MSKRKPGIQSWLRQPGARGPGISHQHRRYGHHSAGPDWITRAATSLPVLAVVAGAAFLAFLATR